jgi:ethanolaminephosphotransferase
MSANSPLPIEDDIEDDMLTNQRDIERARLLGGDDDDDDIERQQSSSSTSSSSTSSNNKKRSIYISEQGKKNLAKYKYSGSDHSLISPFLQPFWNWIVNYLPETMAPNTVTFVGFLGLIGSYALTAFYCPNISGALPKWAYTVNIVLLFWYQTLDAIDGKQARRTGSSSPLGELFDHGCDALGSMLQTMTVLMVAQIGSDWMTWVVLMVINIMFFFSIWEQYYTHVLNFHVLAGPTEGEFVAMLVCFVTLVFGTRIWEISLAEYFLGASWANVPVVSLLALRNILCVGVIISGIPTIYSNISGVIKATPTPAVDLEANDTNEQVEEKNRLRQRYAQITPIQALLPYLTLLFSWIIWMYCSPASLMQTNTLLSCSTYGIVSAYLVTRLVLCRVTDEIAPKFYYILLPLPFIALFAAASQLFYANAEPSTLGALRNADFYLLVTYLIYVTVFYAHFVYDVIENITEHLGIYCFSLVKRNQQL